MAPLLDTIHEIQGKKIAKLPAVRIWAKGSRCGFPGIESSNPKLKHSPPRKRVPRGKIETLSESSRRNLKLTLHTINFEALAYTMALTLPGCTDGISGAFAKKCFIVLCNRMSASRLQTIRLIGMVWKQELQKHGEVHFHLVLLLCDRRNPALSATVDCRAMERILEYARDRFCDS